MPTPPDQDAEAAVDRLLDIDVAEPSGQDIDPNNEPSGFQQNFKDRRYWHRPKQGFRYSNGRLVYPADTVPNPVSPPACSPPAKPKQLDFTLEARQIVAGLI